MKHDITTTESEYRWVLDAPDNSGTWRTNNLSTVVDLQQQGWVLRDQASR